MRHTNKFWLALTLCASAALAQSGGNAPQPWLGTPISATANGANTRIVAVFPAVADRTNYLSSFTVTSLGSTAGGSIMVTVTGINGTLNYVMSIPAGVGNSATPLSVNFNPPLAASNTNTQITVVMPAAGDGNTAQFVSATGYLK